jgi:hypothetical protein
MAFGWWFEKNAADSGMVPLFLGSIIFLIPWAHVGVHLLLSEHIADGVVALYLFHFVLMWTFPAALLHHWETFNRTSLRAASCKVCDLSRWSSHPACFVLDA